MEYVYIVPFIFMLVIIFLLAVFVNKEEKRHSDNVKKILDDYFKHVEEKNRQKRQ